jgi:hypothetical protein
MRERGNEGNRERHPVTFHLHSYWRTKGTIRPKDSELFL